jgi:hypothetical protein
MIKSKSYSEEMYTKFWCGNFSNCMLLVTKDQFAVPSDTANLGKGKVVPALNHVSTSRRTAPLSVTPHPRA